MYQFTSEENDPRKDKDKNEKTTKQDKKEKSIAEVTISRNCSQKWRYYFQILLFPDYKQGAKESPDDVDMREGRRKPDRSSTHGKKSSRRSLDRAAINLQKTIISQWRDLTMKRKKKQQSSSSPALYRKNDGNNTCSKQIARTIRAKSFHSTIFILKRAKVKYS